MYTGSSFSVALEGVMVSASFVIGRERGVFGLDMSYGGGNEELDNAKLIPLDLPVASPMDTDGVD
jgi:hypothetical protein